MRWHEKINRWLATFISELNAALALALITVAGLVGSAIGSAAINNGFLGLIFGIAAGGMVTVQVCGIIAILIDIRNSMAHRD